MVLAGAWLKGTNLARVIHSCGSLFTRCTSRYFNVHSIAGRLFYRKRPRCVPIQRPKNVSSKFLLGCPQKKGIVVRLIIKHPRKPNSSNVKTASVKLSTGVTVSCRIPGEGHNLNVHSIVLVRGGKYRNITGLHYTLVRGVYDLLPVKGRVTSRSQYGAKLSPQAKEQVAEKKNLKWLELPSDRQVFNTSQWFAWKNPDGTYRTSPLKPDEPVPQPLWFNWHRKKMLELKMLRKREDE